MSQHVLLKQDAAAQAVVENNVVIVFSVLVQDVIKVYVENISRPLSLPSEPTEIVHLRYPYHIVSQQQQNNRNTWK